MNTFEWIDQTLAPRVCNSEEFFYNEMDSQSGYCLPVIYQPFDARSRSHWHDRGALFDFLYATGGEGQSLLDFGPGDGWPSLIVAPFARQVIGVDGSPRRVEVCTQNAQRLNITNAHFQYVEPGSPLPFADETFDGVMAASSIEQSPDPQATLRELYRVLRPGGRLRVSYENLNVYQDGREHEIEIHPIDEDCCCLTLYDRHIAEEYAQMIRLSFTFPQQEAARLFLTQQKPATWNDDETIPLLDSLRPRISEARRCTLSHPSGETLVRWMKESRFQSVLATHSGDWFAGQLYNQFNEAVRPGDMAGVDALLRPLVKIVVQMAAPTQNLSGWDALVTAIK